MAFLFDLVNFCILFLCSVECCLFYFISGSLKVSFVLSTSTSRRVHGEDWLDSFAMLDLYFDDSFEFCCQK